jgi:hypothetical protein
MRPDGSFEVWILAMKQSLSFFEVKGRGIQIVFPMLKIS